jgi:transcriptional regulator with PAS, ATPase and Fis domain
MRRLGGREEIALDIHLVAATNRELAAEVKAGTFRADLFYRLDVVRVELPPVRDREEDAWILAESFLRENCRRLGRSERRLDPSLRQEVLRYPWPGNVREIRNHMERLLLLAKNMEEVLTSVDLPREGNGAGDRVQIDFSRGPVPFESIETLDLTGALRTANGNVSEAARLLGMGRGALRYRMSRLGLRPDGGLSGEIPGSREAA